jgi:hypothetical protein
MIEVAVQSIMRELIPDTQADDVFEFVLKDYLQPPQAVRNMIKEFNEVMMRVKILNPFYPCYVNSSTPYNRGGPMRKFVRVLPCYILLTIQRSYEDFRCLGDYTGSTVQDYLDNFCYFPNQTLLL